MHFRSFALAFVLLFSSSLALYGPKSDVIMLTKKNFDKEVMNSNHVWLVEFFAPWCGHCKQLAPAWEQVAKKLKGIVKVAAVDADAEREIGGRFGIKGFPTIKAFKSPVGGAASKKGGKTPIDYNGGRTAKDLIAYATGLLPNKNVEKLSTQASLDAFLAKSAELPKAILFTEKPTVPPMFTSLSLEFHERASFAFVPKAGAAESVLSQFSVTSFPSVIVLKNGVQTNFDGEMKPEKLEAFLSSHVSAAEGSSKPASSSSSKQAKDHGDEEEEPKPKKPTPEPTPEEPVAVHEITSDQVIEERCEIKRGLCLLAFLDPTVDETSHNNYLKVLLEVAQKHKDLVSVVWVEPSKQPQFFEFFEPSDLPALRLWNKKRGSVANVVASMTTASISRFVSEAASGRARTASIGAPPAIVVGGVKYEVEEEEPFVNEHVGKDEL